MAENHLVESPPASLQHSVLGRPTPPTPTLAWNLDTHLAWPLTANKMWAGEPLVYKVRMTLAFLPELWRGAQCGCEST